MDDKPVSADKPGEIDPVKTPDPAPSTQTVVPPGEGGSKMVLWLVLGLVVIILLIGGIYWYLSKQQAVQNPNTQAPSSSPQAQENLENDLNSADSGDPTKDFTQVDSDLQSL